MRLWTPTDMTIRPLTAALLALGLAAPPQAQTRDAVTEEPRTAARVASSDALRTQGTIPVELRQGAEEGLGVRVLRSREELARGRLLDHLTRIHDHDVVGDLGDHAHVVGDRDHRHVVVAPELVEEIEHLRLHGHVECGRRLVRDQQVGLARDRDRDHHALAHAAREPMRVVLEPRLRLGDPNLLEQLDAKCERVSVTELRDNTFYASITISVNGSEIEIDSRPSDAIALAVRCSAPIFAAEDVIEESSIEFEHEVEDQEEVVEKFKDFLDEVSPEDFASGSD